MHYLFLNVKPSSSHYKFGKMVGACCIIVPLHKLHMHCDTLPKNWVCMNYTQKLDAGMLRFPWEIPECKRWTRDSALHPWSPSHTPRFQDGVVWTPSHSEWESLWKALTLVEGEPSCLNKQICLYVVLYADVSCCF